MSDFRTQEAGGTNARGFTLIKRADGFPITTGTVNWYLKCISGANPGKWWRDSDQTWQAAETANAMTHQADGHWTRTLAATPFIAADLVLEYAKESGDLHVPVCRTLAVIYTPSANSDRRVDVGSVLGTASAGTAGYMAPDWGHVNAPTSTVNLSGTTVGIIGTNGITAGSIASAALTAAKFANDSLTAAALAADAVTEISDQIERTGGLLYETYDYAESAAYEAANARRTALSIFCTNLDGSATTTHMGDVEGITQDFSAIPDVSGYVGRTLRCVMSSASGLVGAETVITAAVNGGGSLDLTFAPAFPAAPQSGDEFLILPNLALRGDPMALTTGERTTLVSAFWAAATRTLTSLSGLSVNVADKTGFSLTSAQETSLIAGVWNYTARSLTSFGTLVADTVAGVWAAVTRTLTGLPDPAPDGYGGSGGGTSVLYGDAGAIAYTYTVFDVGGTTPLPGVAVYVSSDDTGLNRSQTKLTDSLGRVTFNLDAGAVYFWRSRHDRTFVDPDSKIVG